MKAIVQRVTRASVTGKFLCNFTICEEEPLGLFAQKLRLLTLNPHWVLEEAEKRYEDLGGKQMAKIKIRLLKGHRVQQFAAVPRTVVQSVENEGIYTFKFVGGEQISSIGRGICVLLGLSVEDTQKELEHMVRKILNLRVFEDESGKHWSKSVMDKQYEVLCVSQFTLQCILKGNKPDYHMAMPTDQAETFYNSFLEQLRKTYKPELIKDGKFGEHMQVHIQNDGPVTIELESPAAPIDSKQLAKLEKQQQRKEKTRTKVPSESSRERNVPRSKNDPSASSGAEGDVSSEREP